MADETGDLTAEAEETLASEEAPSRPDWLPEQYADEQAFAKGHHEAQRKISEQGKELREMREQLESLSDLVQEQPTQQQNQFADPNQNPFVLAYQRAVEEGDIAAQLSIQAQLTDTVIAQRLEAQAKQSGQDQRGLDPYLIGQMRDQIATKHGADDALQAKAFEIMETNPMFSERLDRIAKDPNATIGDLAPVVETAYELAKGGMVQNQQQQSLAQQQAEQERARDRKVAQESLTGTGGRVASQSEQEQAWARIQNADTGGLRVGQQ